MINFASRNVLLENSTLSFNRRAGASVFGCSDGRDAQLTLKDNSLATNAFDLELDRLGGCTGSPAVTLNDGGGNYCDGTPSCHAVSAGGFGPIEPPPSPP